MVLICKTLILLHQRMLCAKFGCIGPMVLKNVFKIGKCISTIFVIISLWKRTWSSVEQPWISFTCQVWLKLTLWFCRIRFLKILTLYFCYFVIIFPWIRTCSFIWANLEFPLPKEALCQVWLKLIQWFWRSFVIMHGSGEEHFLILSVDFLCFVIISPWKRVGHSFEKT